MRNKVIFIVIIILCISSLIVYGYNKTKIKVEEERTLSINDVIEITAEDIRKVTRNGDTNIGNGGNGGDYDNTTGKQDTILGNEQDEGVRVTLVDLNNTPVTSPIDFANNPRQPIEIYLGNGNKLYYKQNQKLTFYNGNSYKWYNPDVKLPKIVGGDLQIIKNYFGDEVFVRYFSGITGFNYDEMISGKYKIMLEPVGYPKIKGKVTACTATELALLDIKMNGSIRKGNIQNFSHMNLPLSMFLEKNEFGIPAYLESTNTKKSNDTIIKFLGVGAVTFKEKPEDPPAIDKIDYVYRTDTEVITSIKVSGGEANPDKPKSYAVFHINGQSYESNQLTYPNGEFAYAYVKWKTPKKPQKIQIPVTIYTPNEESIPNDNGGFDLEQIIVETTINVEIVDLEENPPPNPDADDRNDNFKYIEEPEEEVKENPVHEWKEYEAVWVPDWQKVIGEWRDLGHYEYSVITYRAELDTDINIVPASTVKTAKGKEMKSGYGIQQETKTKIKVTGQIDKVEVEIKEVGGRPPISIVHRNTYPYDVKTSTVATKSQNAVSVFSDFYYKTYWRLLEDINSKKSKITSIFEFKNNRYSTYNHRTHFTPIWYPDYTDYKVKTYVFDSWTPVGMLSKNIEDSVYIVGNLWDDYYVQPLPYDYE